MKRKGYSLIEMLTVIAIIGILVGLLIAGLAYARQKAKIAKCKAEVRQLSVAWKTYWLVYGSWPPGCANQNKEMDGSIMQVLMGGPNDNTQKIIFLDLGTNVLGNGFKDPWGHVYKVDFRKTTAPMVDWYESTVAFPNRRMYDYE